jgi:hypothetical protein
VYPVANINDVESGVYQVAASVNNIQSHTKEFDLQGARRRGYEEHNARMNFQP